MPITTWDAFKDDPDVQKIVVAKIRPWKVMEGWTAYGAATHSVDADHPYDAVEEYDTSTQTVTAYAYKATPALVESNDGSWTIDSGSLIVNPVGASGMTNKKIRASYELAADTHGKIFDAVFHEPIVAALPDLTHRFDVLDSGPAKSDGRIELADDPANGLDLTETALEEIFLNAETDLYLGGEALPFSEYRHFHAGVVRGWEIDGDRGRVIVSIDDRRRLFREKIVITPGSSVTYVGRADQIYSQILTQLGLSSSGIPDLSSLRPYTLRITLSEDTRVEDVLALVDRSALTYHLVDRSGTVVLKPWIVPDALESGVKTYDENLECRNLRIQPMVDRLFTRVKVTFGSGALATRQRASDRPETRHAQAASGWTLHPTASNLYYTSWDVQPDEVTMDGGLIPGESSLAAANTNDQSWFYSDNERRLYVNPTLQTTAASHDWRVFWRQEKSRSAASGTGYNDENVVSLTNAEAEWKYGLKREWRIDTVIDNLAHAQSFAQTALDLISAPMLEASFEAVLRPLDNELGDTVLIDPHRARFRDGQRAFRIRSIQEDYVRNRIRIRAWKPYQFED